MLIKCLVINIVSLNFKNIDYFFVLKNKCKIVKFLKLIFGFYFYFLNWFEYFVYECLVMNFVNVKYDIYYCNYINIIINLYYECSVNNN